MSQKRYISSFLQHHPPLPLQPAIAVLALVLSREQPFAENAALVLLAAFGLERRTHPRPREKSSSVFHTNTKLPSGTLVKNWPTFNIGMAVQKNLRFQLVANCCWRSVLAVEASMAAHNLSWRGLEHCQPAYLGGCKDTFQASQDYIQSVLHAADFLQSQRYDIERGSSNSHDDPSNLGDTTESLADVASSLSQEDSQRASLRGQQDAWMAREEMDPARSRLSFYRGPMISNEQNYRLLSSCNSDYPSFLFQDDHHRDNTRSLVFLFVLWLMLLAKFSLTNEQ